MENQSNKSNKVKSAFAKLNAYDHLLVFMAILTVLKVLTVFVYQGIADGLHLLKLAVFLFAGSSLVFFVFRFLFDKTKTYKNALISTFILLLVLAHNEPYVVGGLLMMLSVYTAKFLIKINKRNVFNPIVFGIVFVTMLSWLIPTIDTPPATFELLDFRFLVFNQAIPFAFAFLTLSLIFNTRRVKRFSLALSFIIPSLLLGLVFHMDLNQYTLYALGILFTGIVIVIEPKTSPSQTKQQIIYGAGLAMLIAVLKCLKIPNSIFIGLFICNIVYAVYVHQFKMKSIKNQVVTS